MFDVELEPVAEVDGVLVVEAFVAADTLTRAGVEPDGALDDVGVAIAGSAGVKANDSIGFSATQNMAAAYLQQKYLATRQSADTA